MFIMSHNKILEEEQFWVQLIHWLKSVIKDQDPFIFGLCYSPNSKRAAAAPDVKSSYSIQKWNKGNCLLLPHFKSEKMLLVASLQNSLFNQTRMCHTPMPKLI